MGINYIDSISISFCKYFPNRRQEPQSFLASFFHPNAPMGDVTLPLIHMAHALVTLHIIKQGIPMCLPTENHYPRSEDYHFWHDSMRILQTHSSAKMVKILFKTVI